MYNLILAFLSGFNDPFCIFTWIIPLFCIYLSRWIAWFWIHLSAFIPRDLFIVQCWIHLFLDYICIYSSPHGCPPPLDLYLTSGLISRSVAPCALSSHTTASSSSRTSVLSSGAIIRLSQKKKTILKMNSCPCNSSRNLHFALCQNIICEKTDPMNEFPGATEIGLAQSTKKDFPQGMQQRASATYYSNYSNHERYLSNLCILLAFWWILTRLSDVTESRKSEGGPGIRLCVFYVQIQLALCSRCCSRLCFHEAVLTPRCPFFPISQSVYFDPPLLFPSFSPSPSFSLSLRCRRGSLILPRDL